MKISGLVFAFCVLSSSTVAHGQAATPADCQRFTTAVEDAEKDMSMLTVDGILENSAIRDGARQQTLGNDLQLIALNTNLANQLHCPSRKEPIRMNAYFLSATTCARVGADFALDIARGGSTPTTVAPECDRRNWKRESETK